MTSYSGTGAADVSGQLRGDGLRVAIACARFNDLITDRLLAGYRYAFLAAGGGLLAALALSLAIPRAWSRR